MYTYSYGEISLVWYLAGLDHLFFYGREKAMLQKVKAFLEKKLPFLFDDDLYFKVRDVVRLLGDLIVWPYNYVKSFFK